MERVFLRPLDCSDAETIYSWHNDPELYRTLGGTFHFVSRDAVGEWLRKKLSYSSQEVNLAICVTSDTRHIGNIYLRDIDWTARHGELHIFIGDVDQRSKGYGAAAIRLLMEHAFRDLGLVRLYLFVLADNRAAIRAYEKCGFTSEGQLRNHAFKGGEFKDVLIMGVCADDTGAVAQS